MNETIVVFHGGCRDGFCASWVVNKYFKDRVDAEVSIEYIPGFYGQEPPDVKDKNVIIVDFCYPLEVMDKIAKECESLIWLDHHKTAQPVANAMARFNTKELEPFFGHMFKYVFDITRSGAGIAWDYFFPNEPRPWLVDYVEDRDLWKHKLVNSEIVNAYIACLEFDFTVWDKVSRNTEPPFEYGSVAKMKTEQYVREVCKNVYFASVYPPNYMPFHDMSVWLKIPVVNICQVDCSEVLAELLKLYPSSSFSLYWFKRADEMYQYGLRSIGDFDVSAVAKLFGGGGHLNAAGFQLNYLLEELK